MSDLVRHDIIPVLSGYVLLMGMLLLTHGRPRAADGPKEEVLRVGMAPYRYGAIRAREHRAGFAAPGDRRAPAAVWPRLLRHVLATAAGGYVLFLAIVLIYYFVLGGETARFIRNAVLGGAWLAFGVAVPSLLIAAWLEDRFGSGSGDR